MANDTVHPLGVFPQPSGSSRATIHPSHGHGQSMISLTNRSGGSVVTGDVVVQDTGNASSFTSTTTEGDVRAVYVVPYNLDLSALETSKTIANTESGYVWAAGAPYVSVVNCDTVAVAIGDYLVTSATAKKATSSGINSNTGSPPLGAFAIALSSKAGGSNGTVAAMMLGANQGRVKTPTSLGDYLAVGTTTTETTLYSVSVAAGTMGTHGYLRLRTAVLIFNNTGGGVNYTMRLKLGATTLLTFGAFNVAAHATSRSLVTFDMIIRNAASAASQFVGATVHLQAPTAFGASSSPTVYNYWASATENTANALTLAFTVEMGTSSANATWQSMEALLEGPFSN